MNETLYQLRNLTEDLAMRMKDYSFTLEEVLVLRDAVMEEYQRTKHLTSERAVRRTKVLSALKEQFKDDAMKMPSGE